MQDTACYREAIRLGYFLNVPRQTDSPQSRALRRICPVAGVWLVPRGKPISSAVKIFAQSLHKTRPDILFAQFLHKQAACTEFALKYLPKIAQKCTNYLAIISFYLLLCGQ
jgi:hypothetical protein